ncbi:MAG: N-acetylmuramoyl-L-alanine amidase family protein, partial [Mesonia sp.]
CNHSENPNAKGLEVYVFNRKNKRTKSSILYAYRIQKAMQQNLGFKTRGVKFANFQVLRETNEYFPSVLVEFGFLSNKDESDYLSNEKSQYIVARMIFQSTLKFLGL